MLTLLTSRLFCIPVRSDFTGSSTRNSSSYCERARKDININGACLALRYRTQRKVA